MSKTYTVNEAASELDVTPGRVRQMIIDGLLHTTRFGNLHVITSEALSAARARKTKPGPTPKANGNGKASVKPRKRTRAERQLKTLS